MTKRATYRVNADGWWKLQEILTNGEEFNPESASLRGRETFEGVGRLSEEWQDSIAEATYFVYSYATPIAWKVGGSWVTPPEKYSVTTSKHQGKVFTAISQI